ncbi:hypothetical protein EVAR_3691_1 [Eumeta japonica]|uniref:Uncharacterized protein n=1 Tax=Eumeta variegata TaxID=151549 RepID=A0A4C1SS63_EUMVA|nr:hypothetical protein EVAR_3691_1 [Eumeta japonica]
MTSAQLTPTIKLGVLGTSTAVIVSTGLMSSKIVLIAFSRGKRACVSSEGRWSPLPMDTTGADDRYGNPKAVISALPAF